MGALGVVWSTREHLEHSRRSAQERGRAGRCQTGAKRFRQNRLWWALSTKGNGASPVFFQALCSGPIDQYSGRSYQDQDHADDKGAYPCRGSAHGALWSLSRKSAASNDIEQSCLHQRVAKVFGNLVLRPRDNFQRS